MTIHACFRVFKALTLIQEMRLEVRFYLDVSLSPVLHIFTSLVKGTLHIINHRHDPSCLESKCRHKLILINILVLYSSTFGVSRM